MAWTLRALRSADVTRFQGFPRDAIEFYEQLDADNSKTFWVSNRDRYDASVRAPMDAFLGEVTDEFGPFHVFRPYRDVRFSKDKTPYKTHIGAYGEREGGAGYYVQLSAEGLMAASGYYAMASDQLTRFREAVDDAVLGTDLVARLEPLVQSGLEIGAVGELKTAPRGYPRDHPRIDILRRKGLMLSRSWPTSSWLHTRRAATRVVDTWRSADAVNQWLDIHVGPSEEPPGDGWR
jgi:uncharacterized protein (TIGR02453 family)